MQYSTEIVKRCDYRKSVWKSPKNVASADPYKRYFVAVPDNIAVFELNSDLQPVSEITAELTSEPSTQFEPRDICLRENKLYVGCQYSNNIYVFDGEYINNMLHTIPM